MFLDVKNRYQAQMAELVDALVSGTSVCKYVQVRVLFWAQEKTGQQAFMQSYIVPEKFSPEIFITGDIFEIIEVIVNQAQVVKLVDTPA